VSTPVICEFAPERPCLSPGPIGAMTCVGAEWGGLHTETLPRLWSMREPNGRGD
jgi:hypothetical protein